MRFALPVLLASTLFCSASAGHSKPQRLDSRQNVCFISGGVTLPAEVANGVADLARVVRCDGSSEISPGIPDLRSGPTSLADIDFQDSALSPLGFAEQAFAIPETPSTISQGDLATLQDQLNVYLAWEAGVRSQAAGNSRLLSSVKSVKFFLQFQQARINAAKGVTVGAAGTVEHQLGKVLKNAIGASQQEKDTASALAALVG